MDVSIVTGVCIVALALIASMARRIRRIAHTEVDSHVMWLTILFVSAFMIQEVSDSRQDPKILEALYMGLVCTLTTLGIFSAARAIELKRQHHAEAILDVIDEVHEDQPGMRLVSWEFLSPNGERLHRISIPEYFGPPREFVYPDQPFLLYRQGVLVYDGRRHDRPLIRAHG